MIDIKLSEMTDILDGEPQKCAKCVLLYVQQMLWKTYDRNDVI